MRGRSCDGVDAVTPAEHVSHFLRLAQQPGAVPTGAHDGETQPMELDDETWARRRRGAEEAARELEEMQQRPPFRMDEHFEEFDPDQEEETAHE